MLLFYVKTIEKESCNFELAHQKKERRNWPLPLALQTLEAFYFTDPTLKATACLLSRVVSCQSEV